MSCAAATGCGAAGVDVSPACIELANSVAKEEGLDGGCKFHVLDVTKELDELLRSKDVGGVDTSRIFRNATVIFLFVYPTLLKSILPLLSRLTDTSQGGNGVRAVVTQTYHVEESEEVEIVEEGRDEENGLRMLSKIIWKGEQNGEITGGKEGRRNV